MLNVFWKPTNPRPSTHVNVLLDESNKHKGVLTAVSIVSSNGIFCPNPSSASRCLQSLNGNYI